MSDSWIEEPQESTPRCGDCIFAMDMRGMVAVSAPPFLCERFRGWGCADTPCGAENLAYTEQAALCNGNCGCFEPNPLDGTVGVCMMPQPTRRTNGGFSWAPAMEPVKVGWRCGEGHWEVDEGGGWHAVDD